MGGMFWEACQLAGRRAGWHLVEVAVKNGGLDILWPRLVTLCIRNATFIWGQLVDAPPGLKNLKIT